MPCRALEAFRRDYYKHERYELLSCLNALSGIGGVQTNVVAGKRPDHTGTS